MANLNDMSNEQREEYRKAVCTAVGLDPNPVLGHLDYIWMPQEDSQGKNLVLYARRGTTELLRDLNAIDVKSLEQHDGPGYVSFKATGTNKKGRQEIAVGAHEIDGLKGKRLADAIATAQTRALRRLTLQFAGYGILDESEVHITLPTEIAAPAASQALPVGTPTVFPPPTVAPQNAPGKDVTPKVAPEAAVQMEIPLGVIDNNGVITSLSVDEYANACDEEAAKETPAAEKPKRTRKRRNAVSLANPEDVAEAVQATCPICGKTIGEHAFKNSELVCPPKVTQDDTVTIKSTTTASTSVKIEATAPQLPPPAPQTAIPNNSAVPTIVAAAVPPAQNDDGFKARLRTYANDVLPKGGMLPTDGIGGVTMKLRAYARKVTGASDLNALTQEQWEVLFEELDTRLANGGPIELVKDINEALGVV